MAVRLQPHEAEEVERLGWRDRYDDQMKDARRPEREQVAGESYGRRVPDDLAVGLTNVVSLG
jgi:hypothetical protein